MLTKSNTNLNQDQQKPSVHDRINVDILKLRSLACSNKCEERDQCIPQTKQI